MEAVDAEEPGDAKTREHQHLADDPGALGAQVVDQQAHEHPQKGACEIRDGHHQALLRRVQVKVGGHQHRQRPQQHPDHEAEVEIEEGREQGGCVARLHE